jgi:peptide/nickel transport system permease protein
LLFGVLAGVYSGRRADKAISAVTLGLLSLPEFVLGTILIAVFFGSLNILPPVSLIQPGNTAFTDPRILVLPVLTLLGVSVAAVIRLVRAGIIDTLDQNYVTVARLNGYSERSVIWRYGLRNSLAPSIIVISQSLQYLLGGIVVTEVVFAYPGIGSLLVTAVNSRDATEIEAIAILLAAAYIVVNIISDLLVVLLVPRLRTAA